MLAAALALAAAAALPALYVGGLRRERARRGQLFSDCLGVFDSFRVTQEGLHYPVLEGRYRGFVMRLEPVLDDLSVRKVPSLWLKTTLRLDNPCRGVLDFLVRPQGNEVYSPSQDLPRRLPVPSAWPQHAVLCSDGDGKVSDIEALTPHMSAFEDPRTKELLVTPRGVRLVYQAAQARRAEYLVLRQAKFDSARLSPALVKALMDRVISIAAALDAAFEVPAAEAA